MTPTPHIYALIVAAGSGVRAGGAVPKQYARVGGKALLRYSIAALQRSPHIAGVQLVIHPGHAAAFAEATAGLALLPPVMGGAERADSVAAGLNALAHYRPDYVLIHDAARPFLRQALIAELVAALTPNRAVVPALPVADTVRRNEGARWTEVPRQNLLRMQTPQAFPFARLRGMLAQGYPAATDEAAIWLAAGGALGYVRGDEDLRKVTTMDDIAWAERTVSRGGRIATGLGFDTHALMPSGERGVIRLGGIDIEHRNTLHGHSDADVVLHAVVDALLGAISMGDIGSHFPPSEERWRGADSAIFVEEARAQVARAGGRIDHLDITIMAEAPKIGPHREAMRAAIAGMLHLPLSHVSVKATTTEKLGFTGREEGIAAQAVATVRLEDAA